MGGARIFAVWGQRRGRAKGIWGSNKTCPRHLATWGHVGEAAGEAGPRARGGSAAATRALH